MILFKALSLLRECAYKRGESPSPSVHFWCLEPACMWCAEKDVPLECIRCFSAGSSVLERAVAGGRTKEPSRAEGSTLGNFLLSGSKIKVWISLLQG